MILVATWHMALSLGGALVVGCIATWIVAALTRRLGLLDRPNARSAHTTPTPTAGGLGIVAGFWSGMALLRWVGGWSGDGMVGWLGASAVLLLAVVDDVVRPLRPWEKMLLLLLAIAVWLGCGPRLEWLALPGLGRVELGWWGWPLTIMWFVLLCNAFNFMDGIDGLSAVQTLCACFWAGLLLWELGGSVGLVAWILAAAAGGFLVFNFPPARIFMGDVGALFSGFSVAACGILGARAGLPLWIFGALLAVFIFDVGYTLIRRALRGENLLQAHRKHLYQRLDKLGWSHWWINAVAVCITSVMGLGAYWHMDSGGDAGLGYFILGGVVLVVGAVWIEARDPEFA